MTACESPDSNTSKPQNTPPPSAPVIKEQVQPAQPEEKEPEIELQRIEELPAEATAPQPVELPGNVSRVEGITMTIPYAITVGRSLDDKEQKELQHLLNECFEDIDLTYNKWNPHSEVSLINRASAGEKVKVSKELERFLLGVGQVVELTNGLFDPTMLPLQDLWKNRLAEGAVPQAWEIEALESAVGWDKLQINGGYVTKAHKNTAIDLSGIAKGFAVDQLVTRLQNAGHTNALIEWGGEIRTTGQHPDGRPWTVFISALGNPDPKEAIETLALNDMALATSGDYEQQWTVQDGLERKTYSHIVHPRTKRALEVTPESVASTSVLAPNCMLADALATAAMLQPDSKTAQAWAEEMQSKLHGTAFWIVTRSANTESSQL